MYGDLLNCTRQCGFAAVDQILLEVQLTESSEGTESDKKHILDNIHKLTLIVEPIL